MTMIFQLLPSQLQIFNEQMVNALVRRGEIEVYSSDCEQYLGELFGRIYNKFDMNALDAVLQQPKVFDWSSRLWIAVSCHSELSRPFRKSLKKLLSDQSRLFGRSRNRFGASLAAELQALLKLQKRPGNALKNFNEQRRNGSSSSAKPKFITDSATRAFSPQAATAHIPQTTTLGIR